MKTTWTEMPFMQDHLRLLIAGCLMALPALTSAQTPAVEEATLGEASIRLHPHPFLTAEELATLRLVMTNEQALSLFVPNNAGHAALAVSPEDGFIRDGKPVASAIAIADLPDAAAAASAALAGCDGAKTGAAPCVVVLEVAPAN